jgi:hypothetical protein
MLRRLLRSLRLWRPWQRRERLGHYTVVFTQHPLGVGHALFAYARHGEAPRARTRVALCGVDTSGTWDQRERLVWPVEAMCRNCTRIFGDVDRAV